METIRDNHIDSLDDPKSPEILNLQLFFKMRIEEVLNRFKKHFPAHVDRGQGNDRFLYMPGSREDRVLLVSHADTVWDDYTKYRESTGLNTDKSYLEFTENGMFRSTCEELGIGADDRAGITMLWRLKDLGHSILITSGEEIDLLGSRFLMDHNPDLAAEIQNHRFMMEFDRRNSRDFKTYNVGTDEFRDFITKTTGYREPDRESESDISVLAKDICGANLSVGYYEEHTPNERLNFEDWLNTLKISQKLLSKPDLPKFRRGR